MLLAHLSHFETPKTWAEIPSLTPKMSKAAWREAIAEVDELGEGLLEWIETPKSPGIRLERHQRGAWVLSESGREYLARYQLRLTPTQHDHHESAGVNGG